MKVRHHIDRKQDLLKLFAIAASLTVASCGTDDAIIPDPPRNTSPVALGAIPAQDVPATDTVVIDLTGYFSDPDGDALTFAASSSDAGVASVSVSGSLAMVVGLARGSATITVSARDPGGLEATQTAAVNVVAKPGFLRLVLTSSEFEPGAVIVGLEGPSIDSVSVMHELILHYIRTPSGIRAFVGASKDAGTLPSDGTILRFWSEDVSEVSSYTAIVEQVAAQDYAQLPAAAAKSTVIR